jgi:hypothetical protein
MFFNSCYERNIKSKIIQSNLDIRESRGPPFFSLISRFPLYPVSFIARFSMKGLENFLLYPGSTAFNQDIAECKWKENNAKNLEIKVPIFRN